MKKCIYSLLFLFAFVPAWAQSSTFTLQMESSVQNSALTLDVFISKASGPDFALGTSNFDIQLKSADLDLSKATFLPGEFDAATSPDSYGPMGMGSSELLVMNVNVNVKGTGNGTLVTTTKKKIGSISLPILNPCGRVAPKWSKTGAINSFFKSAIGPDITSSALYLDPDTIDLDGGVSKIIPTITLNKGVLVSSSSQNNQWYQDGTLIPGATGTQYVPTAGGKYSVEVTYVCAKVMSAVVPMLVTGLSDFTISSSFAAQPNPFLGESMISYTLANYATIKLQLYNVNGTYLLDLESGQRAQGKHSYLFKLSALGLPAGTYVVKLAMEDKLGTLKIVALK